MIAAQLLVASFVAVASATGLIAREDAYFASLLKRQEPGTPAYNCHDNCGSAITLSRVADPCNNAVFVSDYHNCLKCSGPDNFNIWRYYGGTLSTAGGKCGFETEPLAGKQEDVPEAGSTGAASSAAPAQTSAAAPSSTAASATVPSSTATSAAEASAPASSSAASAISQPSTTSETTSEAPVSSTASPVSSTASPVSSTASPVSSTASPVSSTASPVSSTASPVSSTASPVSSTASPSAPYSALVTSTISSMPSNPTGIANGTLSSSISGAPSSSTNASASFTASAPAEVTTNAAGIHIANTAGVFGAIMVAAIFGM